ncbi:conserved hypothetical protein [Hyella patelloides LEGE 07179]|uniref:Uncharacterized protein n=1 Tax=Hyella patelloides LEGE 07179 TaxID=945734 RepID=A0A563VIS8_9CYAN|nr:DUF692 domain-containing protein [Hyella patelloides]VEP11309.1 conserved hypothetical protein [Hyella patelloides LEGE 07179]
MNNQLETLGIGIGYREQFKSELFLNKETVDFLEIIGDRYLDSNQYLQGELSLLAANFPLVPHFINLSLGSAEGIDTEYLEKLAKLVKQLDPPWWSEHLCFTKAGGIDIGHLAPLPYTKEAVDIVCSNIKQVQSYIETPLILENIAYMVDISGGEMTEAQFIGEIAEKTDCGLLLDITNLYINSTNHDYDIEKFLSQLPLERIVQLHFVGGYQDDGVLIDSHSEATPAEIWQLMTDVTSCTNVNGIILERDENIPPFNELVTELNQARKIVSG